MSDWLFWTKLTTSFVARLLLGIILAAFGSLIVLVILSFMFAGDVNCPYEHGFYQGGQCRYE